MGRRAALATMVVMLGCLQVARADDVTDQINEALRAYQNHDPRTAIVALDAAANMLRQARADSFKALLPPTPAGWTASDAETSALGAAMLGGGITATRKYRNGEQQVEVQVMADSPMLQGMAAVFTGPLAAASGMKTIVVNGRRVTFNPDDNSYITLVADKVIVQVEGNKQTPEPVVKGFVSAIDFAAIEKLVR